MDNKSTFPVELAYGTQTEQWVVGLQVPAGSTIADVIQLGGLEIPRDPVGIFGEVKPLTTPVQAGDRVELYRPLPKDPKAARRERT